MNEGILTTATRNALTEPTKMATTNASGMASQIGQPQTIQDTAMSVDARPYM